MNTDTPGDRLAVHYSSANDSWETPTALYSALHEEFSFDLDPASDESNFKCARHFTVEDDGLAQRWSGSVWCNPPYGRGVIDRWTDKAIAEADHCRVICLLVPARPGSRWFDRLLSRADETRFLSGRVTFEGATNPAPFPSVVFVLKPRAAGEASNVYSLPVRRSGVSWTTVRAVRDAG